MRRLAALLLLALSAGPTTPAPRPWTPLWQAQGDLTWSSRDPDPAAVWPSHKEREWRTYRLCGDVQGQGNVTLAVGGAGDPWDVDSPAPYWEHTCFTTTVGWGGGGATLRIELYLRSTAVPPFYFRPGTLSVSSVP